MNFLVHCTDIGGHQLEYLHHIYMHASKKNEHEYIFVVPERFKEDSKVLSWPICSNIIIDYLDKNELKQTDSSLLKKSFLKSKNLSKYLKKYHADNVILIDLISYIPFIILCVPFSVKIRGIIYRIYLYEWKKESLVKKVLDVCKYVLMTRFSMFEKVFILNDSSASSYLNHLYHTTKFCYLPDPVASVISYQPRNIRDALNISPEKTIFLHPGGMLPYKGTLNILRALDKLEKNKCDKLAIIMAGQSKSIQPDFGMLLKKLDTKVQIIHIEGYIPFEQLADLFKTCNFVLIPYLTKSQSSGIVGHAAYYEKPVIAAKGGVIGKMVQKWKLGILLDEPSVFCIQELLARKLTIYRCGNSYSKDHSVELFNKVIFDK